MLLDVPVNDQLQFGKKWIVVAGILADNKYGNEAGLVTSLNLWISLLIIFRLSVHLLIYYSICKLWSSSLIADRQNKRTLLSASGSRYELIGPMNRLEMLAQGI